MNMEHLAAALDNFTWGPAMIVIMGVTAVFYGFNGFSADTAFPAFDHQYVWRE